MLEVLELVSELVLFSGIMEHDNIVMVSLNSAVKSVELAKELGKVILIIESVEHASWIESLRVEDHNRSGALGGIKADMGL